MEWMFLLLVPVVGYLIYLAAKAAAKAAQERRDALTALATRRGWRFDPDETTALAHHFKGFDAFDIGHSREWYNTLRGYLRIEGRQYDVIAGDYTYKVTQHTGKTTTTVTHNISYLLIECPYPRVPDLLIRREGIMDRITAAIGFADIAFESAAFSRAFYVKGPDRKFAFDVIHPRMIEFLMASDPPPLELRRGQLLVNDDDFWTPEEYDQRIDFMVRFFSLWPKYLQDDLEAGKYLPGRTT